MTPQSAPAVDPVQLPTIDNAANDLPPMAPVKAGFYVARIKNVALENKLNFEKTEKVDKLVFTFELLQNAMTRKPVVDIDGIEYEPLKRLAWRDGDPKSCFSKKGVKTLTKWTGQIVQALGMDPFSASIATADMPGRFCVVSIENYTKESGAKAAKIAAVAPFDGDVAEFDALVAQYAGGTTAPAVEDVDYNADAAA